MIVSVPPVLEAEAFACVAEAFPDAALPPDEAVCVGAEDGQPAKSAQNPTAGKKKRVRFTAKRPRPVRDAPSLTVHRFAFRGGS